MDVQDVFEAIAGTPAERMLAATAEGGVLRNDPAALGLTPDQSEEGFDLLVKLGLVYDDERVGGGWTDSGVSASTVRLARKVVESQRDGFLRDCQVRQMALRCLVELEQASASRVRGALADAGESVSEEEVSLALHSLIEDGLAEGIGTMQNRFVRARITPSGKTAAKSALPLAQYVRRQQRGAVNVSNVTNNTVSAGGDIWGQIQAGGANNTMDVTQQIALGVAEQIVEHIDSYLQEHGSDESAEALSFNRELMETRAEVESGEVTNESWLQRVGGLFKKALPMGADAMTLVSTIAPMIG